MKTNNVQGPRFQWRLVF